jgi:hypothetical protein
VRGRRKTVRLLVEAQYAMQVALSSLIDQSTPPEVGACVRELLYATTWFRGALERHLSGVRDGPREETVGRLGLSTERFAELPTFADRLRLIGRAQRWMVAQIAVLLAEDLEPSLRDLLQEASAICLRGGRRCDEVIAMLDRERELPPTAE